jgi:hypothetical protein
MEKAMVNYRHEKEFIEKILKLMPDDRPIQAKELLHLATNKTNPESMGRDTVYYYLKAFDGIFWDKLQKEHKRQRDSYYQKCKNPNMPIIAREMIMEKVDSLLEQLPKEVQKWIEVELRYMRKHEDDLTEKEEKRFYKEMSNDESEITRALSFILLKQAFELAEETRGLQNGYYMNSKGKVLPKAYLDELLQKSRIANK